MHQAIEGLIQNRINKFEIKLKKKMKMKLNCEIETLEKKIHKETE